MKSWRTKTYRTLISEVVSALAETQMPPDTARLGQEKEAMKARARATGKLDIVLAPDPKLAFATVNGAVVSHDFLGLADAIETTQKKHARHYSL